jgi:putative aldouronate transport system substrate-binding protein
MSWREKTFLICTALAVMVVVALLPTNPKSKAMASPSSAVSWDRVVDDPGKPCPLVWQGIIAHVAGQKGSWIERNLERRFNLALTPVFMDGNGFGRRRPLMLCGGDIPDVMWDGDPLGVRANLRNGFIMEVPYEVILKYAPTYADHVNRYGKEAWLYSHYDGRNYGLPTVFADASRPRIGCWRMDWLRKVGIDKVPETIAEMGEALRRLRFDDPDGNGKLDTYGWSPSIAHWSLAFAEIFAACDVLAFDFMREDGQVVWGGILPGTKAALTVLHEWYRAELLDPDFMLETRDGSPSFINGAVGYLYPVDSYAEYDLAKPMSLAGKVRAFSPTAEIVPGPPLRNRHGERRGRAWGGAGHILQFGKPLEAQPEKVVRVLTMMEACARDEKSYMEAQRGERGVHWDCSPERGAHLLPPYENNQALQGRELLPRTVFYFPSSFDPVFDEKLLSTAGRQWLETYRRPEWSLINVLGKSDVVPSAGRYLGDLRNWQMTVFIEMVVGDRPLDSFDKFVAEWRRRGGDVLTREANRMYDDMQQIFARVGAQDKP